MYLGIREEAGRDDITSFTVSGLLDCLNFLSHLLEDCAALNTVSELVPTSVIPSTLWLN